MRQVLISLFSGHCRGRDAAASDIPGHARTCTRSFGRRSGPKIEFESRFLFPIYRGGLPYFTLFPTNLFDFGQQNEFCAGNVDHFGLLRDQGPFADRMRELRLADADPLAFAGADVTSVTTVRGTAVGVDGRTRSSTSV